MHSGEPLDLWAEVSSLLAVVDPREYGFGRREGELPYSLRELVDMFLDVDRVETSALLTVVAELSGDDVLAARIRRELAGRGDRLPEWLARLGQAEVFRVREMVHVLGDGDDVDIAVRFAGGAELTAVVYIDHNMGTLVKDAFVVPESLAGLEALMRAKADDPDTVWRDLDPADARVRVTEAIERAAMTVPPLETDSWPASRPIVEWLTRRLPTGGVGYQRPEWSEWDRQQLTDRFFASSFGAPLDDPDHRGLLESVIWFGADYGPGDPLRWSPAAGGPARLPRRRRSAGSSARTTTCSATGAGDAGQAPHRPLRSQAGQRVAACRDTDEGRRVRPRRRAAGTCDSATRSSSCPNVGGG